MAPPSLRLTALFCSKWLLRSFGGESGPGSIAGPAARLFSASGQTSVLFHKHAGQVAAVGRGVKRLQSTDRLLAAECVAPRRTLGVERLPDITCRNPVVPHGRFFSILPRFPNVPQAPIAPIQPIIRQGLTATETLLLSGATGAESLAPVSWNLIADLPTR